MGYKAYSPLLGRRLQVRIHGLDAFSQLRQGFATWRGNAKRVTFPGSQGLRPVMQWGPILPIDRSRQVAYERSLVEAGISSRRTASARLGADDAEAEWARVMEERAS